MQLKRSIILYLMAMLLLVTVPVHADDSVGFFSDMGMFYYFTFTGLTPVCEDDIVQADGIEGTFYAPGIGLDLRIYSSTTSDDPGDYDYWLMNYNAFPENTTISKGSLRENGGDYSCSDFYISGLNDHSFTLTFTDEFMQRANQEFLQIYKRQQTVDFTDIAELVKNPKEDRWGGAYFDPYTTEDVIYYYSVVQLYGTNDYMMIMQNEEYGTQQDYYNRLFLQDIDDALIHEEAGGSMLIIPEGQTWITAKYTLGETDGKTVLQAHMMYQESEDSGEVTDYYKCSTKPMWREE